MKPLNEYEKDEEYIIDDNGSNWSSLESFLQGSILKFCCCGLPDENLLLIYDLLNIHDTRQKLFDDIPYENWSKFCEESEEIYKNYVQKNWNRFINFFWYVMDEKNIMEHGTSLPGWIIDHNFIDALKIWKKQYEDNAKIRMLINE